MLTLYLDASTGGTTPPSPATFSIPDPHRLGTVYEGWWARLPDGSVIGKSPQHPASHRLYRSADMDVFLEAAPTPRLA
jgi:hypothetical protein